MLFGVLELQHPELLLRLLQPGPDLPLEAAVVFGHQHRRRVGKFLAQRVTLDHRVLQPAVDIPHAVAGGFGGRRVRPVGIEVGGKDIEIFRAEVGATPLGRAQLLLIGGDLVLEEALRILHVDAVRPGGAFHENRQQGLHHVMRQLGALVAVGDGEQVSGLRLHLNCLGEALQQAFAVRRAGGTEVEVGLRDQLLEVGSAEQGPLQHFELAGRGRIGRQPTQQRGQDRIRIDIQARARLVLVWHQIDADPPCAADQPGYEHADPAAAPGSPRVLRNQELKGIHGGAAVLRTRIAE